MTRLRSLFKQNSIEAIPEQYRAEFWREIMVVNMRRIRVMLIFAVLGCMMLIVMVNILNVLHLPETDNHTVLMTHLLLLSLAVVLAVAVWARPLRSAQDIAPYHRIMMKILTAGAIIGQQTLIYAITITHGHPIFFFAAVIIWYSSLLLAPRVSASVLVVMLAGLWTQLILFSPPTDNVQFAAEVFIFSGTTTLALILSGAFLFRSAVEGFRQRKAVEEERNTIAELNAELSATYLEADTLNHELQQRQEILEEQATEIEIINTQLQEQNGILMRLDTEKNELLGIVSHDLKNPITAILGLAEMLQSDNTLETEQATVITGQILIAANNMLALVKNLLDINRLESGGTQFSFEEFDITVLVDSAVQQYTSIADAKNISIEYSPKAAPVLVFADKQAVMQIVDNLLSNAVKYSPYGKTVKARITNGATASARQIPFVRIEVQDEGEGISDDDMKKLFGKFVRLSARPTGGEHSTGLGLSIVQKLAEAMNGKVWCESEVGLGATFFVELPVKSGK